MGGTIVSLRSHESHISALAVQDERTLFLAHAWWNGRTEPVGPWLRICARSRTTSELFWIDDSAHEMEKARLQEWVWSTASEEVGGAGKMIC